MPWLDPYTAGVEAPATTKLAVEKRLEFVNYKPTDRESPISLITIIFSLQIEFHNSSQKRVFFVIVLAEKFWGHPYQQDRETLKMLLSCWDRQQAGGLGLARPGHWGECLPESVRGIENNKN